MPSPQIYAHRGFSHRYPENTLLAFEQAALAGADGVEFDIHAAADGVPVVVHDLPLGRTVKGTGLVTEFRSDQLAAIFAAADMVLPDDLMKALYKVSREIMYPMG